MYPNLYKSGSRRGSWSRGRGGAVVYDAGSAPPRMGRSPAPPVSYATGPGIPGGTNTFVPDLDASGRLVIGYSRNPARFALPRYVEYRKSDKNVGLYLKLSSQEAARVVTTQEFLWQDNQVRPMHEDGLEQFNMQEYRTQRYDYGYRVGYMTRDQAAWDLVGYQQRIKAAQAMTARTVRLVAVATDTSEWTIAGTGAGGSASEFDMAQDHTSTATALCGGFLNAGTSTQPYLKIAFDRIEALINLDTLGVVDRTMLQVVITPEQASLWAESSEIHEYIKGSYHAKEELIEGLHPNNKFGLPGEIYGMPITIDSTVRVTSRQGGTLTKTRAWPQRTALVTARTGGIEGMEAMDGKAYPSYSTLTMFWYEDEMTVETFDDPKNRLTEQHVVENNVMVVTSPLSGYLLTATTPA